MAIVCRLNDVDSGTTYDFLTAALRIRFDTWRIRKDRDGSNISTFDLVGRTTDALILVAATNIEKLIEEFELAQSNQFYEDMMYFEYKSVDEVAKRSLISAIDFYPAPTGVFTPVLGKTGVIYKMAISHGVWEDVTVTSVSIQADKTTLGSTYTQAAIKGNLPARLKEARFQGQNVAGIHKEVWFGIRPTREGVTSFNPLWQWEGNSTGNRSADTTEDNIVGASPSTAANNCLSCDFSTSTGWLERAAHTASDAIAGGSDYQDFLGSYLVLLGYKMSSTGTNVAVELKTAYPNNTTPRPHGAKVLSYSATWKMVELGEVRIPPFPARDAVSATRALMARDFELQLWVKRTGGAGAFQMDFLGLVPSEHYTYSDNNEIQYDGASTNTYYNVLENGEKVAWFAGPSARIGTNLVATFNNWHLPVEGGLFVCFAQSSTGYAVAHRIGYGYTYIPRHRNHREAA